MITIPTIDGKIVVEKILPPIIEGSEERIMILTGKRKRADIMHWNGGNAIGETGDREIKIQGLHTGRYGDATAKASDVYRFLETNAPLEAFHFLTAWTHWES